MACAACKKRGEWLAGKRDYLRDKARQIVSRNKAKLNDQLIRK
jgi:hypothetical protein